MRTVVIALAAAALTLVATTALARTTDVGMAAIGTMPIEASADLVGTWGHQTTAQLGPTISTAPFPL